MADPLYGILPPERFFDELTERERQTFRDNGLIRRLLPKVYALSACPSSWQQLTKAGTLWLPRSVASHHTAAVLYGMLAEFKGKPVLTHRGSPRRTKSFTLHRTDQGGPVRSLLGVPVPSPERTLIDVASLAPKWEIERAFENALDLRLVTFDSTVAEIDRIGKSGRRGTGILESVLSEFEPADQDAREKLARRAVRALRAAGLPEPVQEHRVRVANQDCYIDIAYPSHRIGIEVQSRKHHTKLRDFEKDIARTDELTIMGYRMSAITHRNFDSDIQRIVRLFETFGARNALVDYEAEGGRAG